MKEISEIEKKIMDLMGREDRKDVEFRYAIATTEFGDLGKYITHDPKLNPNARPHGTKDDEILAYGQAFVQLAAVTFLRGISLEEAVAKGLENWIENDWRKAKAREENAVKGQTACPGYAAGEAYVAKNKNAMKSMPAGSILVTEFATPDLVEYISLASAIVTDHGGKTCHLANISREMGKPCIVGTGNATAVIKTGDMIVLDASEEVGKVYKK